MKTKFTSLVVLHKKKVDEMQMLLQNYTKRIVAKQAEIDALVAEFAALKEPQSGIYQAFLTFAHHKEEYRCNIDDKMQELAILKQEKRELQERFKLQNIEYEKAKYLEKLEAKKLLHQIQKQESREMDEVSVMLYANNNIS